jgi:hypothetical protein
VSPGSPSLLAALSFLGMMYVPLITYQGWKFACRKDTTGLFADSVDVTAVSNATVEWTVVQQEAVSTGEMQMVCMMHIASALLPRLCRVMRR